MKIVVDDENAFIHLRGNQFLCIGPKKLVQKADEQTKAMMIKVALAFQRYNDIQFSDGSTLH